MSTTVLCQSATARPGNDPKSPPAIPGIKGQSRQFQATPGRKHVVVVDDEVQIADSLTEILTGHGYEARAFYSGRDVINHCEKQCPDIIVADVVMPKLNGVETALAIREYCPEIRVVLFSGQAGTTDILARARAKGHDFELLPKPIHPDRLLRTLAE